MLEETPKLYSLTAKMYTGSYMAYMAESTSGQEFLWSFSSGRCSRLSSAATEIRFDFR